MTEVDVLSDAENLPVGDNAVKNIAGLAARQIELQDEVDTLTEALRERKKQLVKVAEEELPAAMDAVRMKSFELDTGQKVTIKDNTRASITKANQPAAYKWLEDNGHGDVIKREIKLSFGMGQGKDFASVMKLKTVSKFSPEQKETVHSGTLTSLVKELSAEGVKYPEDLLSVYHGRIAKIK